MPKEVTDTLSRADTILVMAHRNPDGDTLGSMLGLGLSLEKMGKQVVMACEDPVPALFRFMPGSERIVDSVAVPVDLAVAVDCGELNMLGRLAPVFQDAPLSIQIDHHELGKPFALLTHIDLTAAAVGEMIYRLLGELGLAPDRDVATCLMVSLMEDTGGFRYPNVTATTMAIAGELLKAGADFPGLIQKLYWSKSPGDIRLSGKIVENVRIEGGGEIAWSRVSRDEIAAYGASEKETSDVVNDLRTIRGVKVAVLFREREDSVRVSLRSRDAYNVAEVAAAFGGGGHINAAGCTIGTGEAARRSLLDAAMKACKD